MLSVPQIEQDVNTTHFNNRNEILALLDHALGEWQRARARFLMQGHDADYRAMLAAQRDRAALLEVGRE